MLRIINHHYGYNKNEFVFCKFNYSSIIMSAEDYIQQLNNQLSLVRVTNVIMQQEEDRLRELLVDVTLDNEDLRRQLSDYESAKLTVQTQDDEIRKLKLANEELKRRSEKLSNTNKEIVNENKNLQKKLDNANKNKDKYVKELEDTIIGKKAEINLLNGQLQQMQRVTHTMAGRLSLAEMFAEMHQKTDHSCCVVSNAQNE